VSFVLTITEGEGSGETYSFDGNEARLGRTADNDVVIRDGSSSRSHARVFEDGGKIFVEDLKSANGTNVNGAAIKGKKALSSGDEIAIGDVTLSIEISAEEERPDSTLEESDEPAADMTLPPRGLAIPKARESKIVQKSQGLRPQESTGKRGALPVAAPSESIENEDGNQFGHESTKEFNVGVPNAIEKPKVPSRPSAAIAKRASSEVARPRDERNDEEEGALAISAADRLRQRRELSGSAAGRFQVLWSDMSKPARLALSIVGSVAFIGLVGLTFVTLKPEKRVVLNEPFDLVPNSNVTEGSFGLGDDVTFERPDQKGFTFTYRSPARIVGVLHFMAKDIQPEEVSVEFNGVQLGFLSPDTLQSDTQDIEIILPASSVKNGEVNEFVFDNVKNPPGKEPWKVFNVRVEMIPIPDMSTESATKMAQDDIQRAQKYEELKNVGAPNLFLAWEKYRDAWLLLEATPARPADLTEAARRKMKELRPELDRKCSGFLIEYQQIMSVRYPKYDEARSTLSNITNYFPNNKHYCFNASKELLLELE
jgi:pSer/pThr/pTyr-binding forkhead associated (FHA) protein